jgi:ribonuclease P/MRP protein subunit RPP40
VVKNKLIQKLEIYGVGSLLIKWINSFLTNRLQMVKVGHSFSPTCSVTSGVPQGSVLGPILFIVYINDIGRDCGKTNTKIKIFADDVKLYSCIDDMSSLLELQNSLDSIADWAATWQLKQITAQITLSMGSNCPMLIK